MPFGKDQDLLADCLHLTEDMAGQDDRMCPAQLPDELADLDDLCRVQADRRFVQNDEPQKNAKLMGKNLQKII